MEKTVVRRGIGAVVLALVAALLLGYLLKGKGPERKEVVNMELPKSPIQIFPSDNPAGAAGAGAGEVAGTSANTEADAQGNSAGVGVAAGAAAGGAATGVLAKAKSLFSFGGDDKDKAAADAKKQTAQAAPSGQVGAGSNAGNASSANAGGDTLAKADNGASAAGLKADATGLGKDQAVDAKTGNASLAKANVTVDGAGQAVFGVKQAGPKDSPAKIDFRTTAKKEVRPSVEGKATLNKKKVASKSKSKSKPRARKSNAKLVGEKKLPPVGRVASKKKKSSGERKIASSRGKAKKSSSRGKKSSSNGRKVASRSNSGANKKVASRAKTGSKKIASRAKLASKASSGSKKKVVSRNTKKKSSGTSVARASSGKKAVGTGRNKYVVQLLATSNSSKANSLKATLKREGYPAFVSKAKRGGKSLYRVRVGSFSKSTAMKKQASMKRRYRKNSYIQSSIVVKN